MRRATILTTAIVTASIALLATAADAATKKTLYSFKGGSDGSFPEFAMTAGPDGTLYGVTPYGGSSAEKGTVFALKPPATAGGAWKETVIHRFTGGAGGAKPQQLFRASTGKLYGTTTYGGALACDCGILYEMTPPAAGKTAWTFRILHTFVGGEDGAYPMGALIQGANGALIGTTAGGGAVNGTPYNKGTIFRITPPPVGQTAKLYVLWAFEGLTKGEIPYAGVVRDASGNLFGTTSFGGSDTYGVVYLLVPPTGTLAPAGVTPALPQPWTYRVIHSFTGRHSGNDGAYPVGELQKDAAGALYGATYRGGATSNENGTVFQVTRDAGGTEKVLYRFKDVATDAKLPKSGLVRAADGSWWGTASGGSSSAYGTVYRMVPGTPWTETVVYRFKGGGDGADPYGALTRVKTRYFGTTRFGGANNMGTIFAIDP